jgi:hypothetical protein
MRHQQILAAAAVLTTSILAAGSAEAVTKFKTKPFAREEVPAIHSLGNGTFTATLNDANTQLNWEFTFGDLGGSVTQAHIHFAQPGVNGGIMVFLCTNLANGPIGTQTCPSAGGTISGVLDASDVVGPTSQGMTVGNFGPVVRALKQGVTYVNLHTDKYPGGEIRGQLKIVP